MWPAADFMCPSASRMWVSRYCHCGAADPSLSHGGSIFFSGSLCLSWYNRSVALILLSASVLSSHLLMRYFLIWMVWCTVIWMCVIENHIQCLLLGEGLIAPAKQEDCFFTEQIKYRELQHKQPPWHPLMGFTLRRKVTQSSCPNSSWPFCPASM